MHQAELLISYILAYYTHTHTCTHTHTHTHTAQVTPLTDFPVPAMNEASRELIAIQATKFAAFSGEMLMQVG